ERKFASLSKEPGQGRSELEAELAKNKQAQASLRHQLEGVQKQLQELEKNYVAERSRLETRTRELQAARSEGGQEVESRSKELCQETKRRELVEKMAVDAIKRRRELEAELAKRQQTEQALRLEMETPVGAKGREGLEAELEENKKVQAQLREQLEQSQKQL